MSQTACRHPKGSAAAALLCLLVGVIIGFAAALAPRFYNVDLFKVIKPDTQAAVEPTVIRPAISQSETELKTLIDSVKAQKKDIEKREADIFAKEKEVADAEGRLLQLKTQMDASVEAFKAFHSEVDADEASNLKKQGKVWGKMDPLKVLPYIQDLGPELSARILATMKENQTAPIFDAMSKDDKNDEGRKLATRIQIILNRMKQKPKEAGGG